MEMSSAKQPIGFYDSGLGGISVLAEAMKLMPNERFIYYADSANAPYGEKSHEEIKRHAALSAAFLVRHGCKAIVVACNTATSVAINLLRDRLNIPVIGMEPALKPAIEKLDAKNILVLATQVTLSEKKFANLLERFEDKASINTMPCPRLAELIEKNDPSSPVIRSYIKEIITPEIISRSKVIVLGCTHYILVRDIIEELAPSKIIIDGNYGTVVHLMNSLYKRNQLVTKPCFSNNRVIFYSSSADESIIVKCHNILDHQMEVRQLPLNAG